MKKLFLIPLLACFSCVMAWGAEVGTFAELQEAIATPNAEITLTAIIDVTADLDLNGATITGYKMYLRVPSDASVVLENGTISNTYTALLSGSGSALYINNGGKVTLRNISLSAYAPVYFKTKGEVEIGTGVTFTSTAPTTRKIFEYSGSTKDAHKITLLSGTNLELNQVDQQIAMNNYYKFTINSGATLTLDGVVARKSATCNASIVNNGTLNIKKYFCVTTLDYSGNGDINISELTTGMRFSDAAFEALHVLDNLDNPSAYKFVKAATKISGVKTIVTDVRLATDEIADVFAEYTDATLGNVEIDATATSSQSLDFADAVTLAGSNELRLIKYVAYKGTIDITGKDIVFANGGLTVQNGSLTITGTGTIRSTNDANNTNCLFQVNGKATDAANYSTLTIGENVTIDGGYCAIGVFGISNGANAYGVTVNMNGTLLNQKMAVTINGNVNATTGNVPVINLNGTINCYNVGAYAAGYGIWNVAGSITTTPAADRTKSSAFAAKSGQININDGAVLVGAGDGSRVEAFSNGVISSGAALQLESNGVYAGGMNIAIADGATLRSNGGWYAIYEYVANANDDTAVDDIDVTGGNFQGGILVSQSLAAKGGFVSGGKWSVDVIANCVTGKTTNPITEDPYFFEVGDPTIATAEIKNEGTNNAVLTNTDGETYAESYSSPAVGTDADVKTTTATNQVVISENTDVVVDQTDENKSTIVEVKKVTVEGDAALTVTEGATLMVGAGAVLLDENTTTGGLTVEAGAALVVDGLVYGSTADNFVIEGEEGKSGIVLFSPETEFVREDHPTATYRFTSKSFYDYTNAKWVYQRFGMPSHDGVVTMKSTNTAVSSYVYTWNGEDWGAPAAMPAEGLVYNDATKAVPFQCYQLASTNVKASPTTYDFVVELMGNADAPLQFKAGWNPYANSYTAPIDIKSFLNDVLANTTTATGIDATIYLYKDLGNDTYTWQGINLGNAGKSYRVRENGAMVKKTYDATIEPMQAFIMKLGAGTDAQADINYLNNVYNPAMGIAPSSAPVRSRYNEVQVGAYNETYWDNISLMEGDLFSAGYDNGYDAPKYDFNRGLSLYVMNGETRMERVATDNVEGLFIGIDAPQAGTYTLDFSDVQGMNYALVDMTTHATITISEGTEYTFYAAQGADDYRFQLIPARPVTTGMEDVEVAPAAKGIYSLTGQYLGEDVKALPAGVYIINGAKVIK